MAQAPGVRVLGVRDPRPHPPGDFIFGDGPVPPAIPQAAQAVAEAADVVLGQAAAPIGQQHEAEERRQFMRRQDDGFSRMQPEPPFFKEHADPSPPLLELFAVVVKQSEVINIAQVTFCAENLLAEVVQTVEIDVGEELAGQVADGQAPASLKGRQQVIAREEMMDRLLRIGTVDDPVGEVQRAFAGDASAEVRFRIS